MNFVYNYSLVYIGGFVEFEVQGVFDKEEDMELDGHSYCNHNINLLPYYLVQDLIPYSRNLL